MTEEFILDTMRAQGRADALSLQERAESMSGTELNAATPVIPAFTEAIKVMNMLSRPVGFVCISTAGRVVSLLQPYDSDIFAAEPEKLPAQWRFVWSTDPEHALPFIALSTSPYAKGDCCLNEAGEARRSAIDGNVWSPDTNPEYWEEA